ncbi:MAG: methylmalonyl-CoA mutase family protein, partial [Flammeovirgaceae bacterium]|nr:methylmalonyl-CoA mutase family protein [Flammeovirgaceae bacterium]
MTTTTPLCAENHALIAQLISAFENDTENCQALRAKILSLQNGTKIPVLGVTGTGGAGKSSLVDELVRRFLMDFSDKKLAIISVDPSKRKTGGALLGDRIRMNAINQERVYMRSLATRQSNLALSKHVKDAIDVLKAARFDLIILETSGIGQSDTEIVDYADVSLYVMTPEYGAATQLEKIDMLDYADIIAINKFDKRGALDAIRDVKKQYKRNHQCWDLPDEKIPVFGTIASQFNDAGMNTLYKAVIEKIIQKTGVAWKSRFQITKEMSEKQHIIPPHRTRYLSEIAETVRNYNQWTEEQSKRAALLYQLKGTLDFLKQKSNTLSQLIEEIQKNFDEEWAFLDGNVKKILERWEEKKKAYKNDIFTYQVRGKEICVETHTKTLSGTRIPKVALPDYQSWGDMVKWSLQENVPGEFPYTSGVFPFKRQNEDPTRMFAGEGNPERTNKRFHYLSKGMPAARLSTAFDSVTLYGEDPD